MKKTKKKRQKFFNQFYVNGNGFFSLAELDKGFLDMGEKMKPIY